MRVLKIQAKKENQTNHDTEDTDTDGSDSEDEKEVVTARYDISNCSLGNYGPFQLLCISSINNPSQ